MLTQEQRAMLHLDHPEKYPSLEAWNVPELIFRVWRYPALRPWSSWLMREKGGEFRVRRLEWDRAGFPGDDPTIYGSEAVIPAEHATSTVQVLRSLSLTPFVKSLHGGIDGVHYGVESKSYYLNGRLSWWSSPPEEWKGLTEWFENTLRIFDTFLPESTARMLK